ncbi:MAG: alpha-amylase family protein [Isosphaeraceae bacterium]
MKNSGRAGGPQGRGEAPWYTAAYRRAVIDMHIPDWDERFLSKVDVSRYVELLAEAHAQSIVAYAMSHVGLFNYPTKVGRQHKGLKGRNLVREILDACHARGIAVQLYNSLIFDRTTADLHPDWRMRTVDGKAHGEGGRHGLLCINSPYREYVRSWVEEECALFDFDGIRFDMTFWPWLCYCPHCKKRFADEVGGELPTTVDWLDERWVAFQRRREAWLGEFAAIATGTVRKRRPGASVEHQSSTYPASWMQGVNTPLIANNDFLQGDFYGDSWQGSFVRKLLEDLTPHRPFGFETSFSMELADHTAMKPEPLLEAKASAAVADNAAFIFIDAIDPIGTLNPKVYERMGRVFERLMPFYQELGGTRVADVAVYYSLDSKFDFAGNGRPAAAPDTTDAHTRCVTGVTRALGGHHLPFTVIGKGTLPHLAERGCRILVLSNVNMMGDDEVEQVRKWVHAGGLLLATGWTSIVDPRGKRRGDFALGDLFGVSLRQPSWAAWPHYVAPTAAAGPDFPGFSPEYPAFCRTTGQEVAVRPDAKSASVLATTTLVWPAPDGSRFSSIHSNPPWTPTTRPEIVLNSFGKGRVIYCASPIESVEPLAATLVRLVRRLDGHRADDPGAGFTFEADAPSAVELTLFHQPERHRYRLSLVNFQKDLPNIPIERIPVRLRLPQKVHRVVSLPDGRAIPFTGDGRLIRFDVPRLETLAMFGVITG